MNRSGEQSETRREWLKSLMRALSLGGIAMIWLGWSVRRTRSSADNPCRRMPSCRDCPALADCRQGRAVMARNAMRRQQQ